MIERALGSAHSTYLHIGVVGIEFKVLGVGEADCEQIVRVFFHLQGGDIDVDSTGRKLGHV